MEVKEREDYCIIAETIMLIPFFNDCGYLYSKVIEGEDVFIVRKSPLQIIEFSLLSYGNNFNGALLASKFHLGGKKMLPIKICGTQCIYLFPTQAYKNPMCEWVFVHHINDLKKSKHVGTHIFLKNGRVLTINMKEKQLKVKINLAKELQNKIEKQLVTIQTLNEEHDGFQIIKEGVTLQYKVKKEGEEV